MKKTLISLMISVFLLLSFWIPVSAASADSRAPQVLDWTVSTSHNGEVRNGTDDQFITMIVTFDQEIMIQDTQQAYDELSVMLNGQIDITSRPVYSNGEDWPVYGSLRRGEDTHSVIFELHYGYAPYASHLTIVPVQQITQITGTDGTPVIWKNVSLYFPNGVTFTTAAQTVGDTGTGTPASVTTKVSAPPDSTRMMIHVLLLKNGQPAIETDSYGSNLTTHFHDYLTLTAEGYVNLFQGWFRSTFGNDYDIAVNGEEMTITSKTVTDGDVLDLRVFAYPRDRAINADKEKLKELVQKAESINPDLYTLASYHLMYDQYSIAKSILASVYYTQEEVNAASDALSTSLDQLQEKNSFNDDSRFPFIDVAMERWSRNAIVFAYNKNLFNGVSSDLFDPSGSMNRAMLVTVLYRMDGSESVTDPSPFTDVGTESYYYDAVRWASARGIVNGMTPSTFEPETGLTREQLATILYRYAIYKGYDTSSTSSLDSFSDAHSTGAFAEMPLKWAVGKGLINGITSDLLSPLTGATREQVASILMRFCTEYQQAV